MTTTSRMVAIAIAVAAAIDPAISISRSKPIAVELVTGPGREALAVRERLRSSLGSAATIVGPGHGEAIVIVDGRLDATRIRDNVTVSAVTMSDPPNLKVVRAAAPSPSVPGDEAVVDVNVDVQGLAGRKSILTVTQKGVEVGRIEQSWTNARRQRVSIPFVPLATTGTHQVRITAVPLEEEARRDDNAIDARISIVDRPLRVAFVEPRPSWSSGFVRRALEADPAFEVASVLRTSRGIDVRAGDAPPTLTAAALERFDAVVVGAPEELRAAELEALRTFMAKRGGAAFFLPDRRPSGPYASLVNAAGFDEVLLNAPLALQGVRGVQGLRASEFAIPRAPGPATAIVASLEDGKPAIVSQPVGEGQLIFSGALDGWRFRGDQGERFAHFWRASIAAAALAAPPPVRVELDPGVVKPGAETRVIVRIRPTGLVRDPDGSIRVPAVRAVAMGKTGRNSNGERIRLWPTTEAGVFEGRFNPVGSDSYHVHVTAGRSQAASLIVEAEIPAAVGTDDDEAAMVASATGGVVTPANDLSRVVDHLRSLRRTEIGAAVHPMRSGWWTVPFSLALCIEWMLRRRRGGR